MNSKTALRILLLIVGLTTVFHICILLKIIPYEITWGGRLKTDSEMYAFESVSLLINLFFGLVLLIKGEFIKALIPMRAVNVILWIFLALFALNTLGNAIAKTNFERYFTIVTLLTAILIWIVLKVKNKKS
ncbi:MAG: hypothetical protein JXR19_11710 [Bacteroidia bacterium]